MRPGDRIRFRPISFDTALALEQAQDAWLTQPAWSSQTDARSALQTAVLTPPPARLSPGDPILYRHDPDRDAGDVADRVADAHPGVIFRQAGDKYILVEYGENVLDLRLRFRIHALMEALSARAIDGIEELSPGVRSVQVRYDSRVIGQQALIDVLARCDAGLSGVDTMRVPSRIVHLPMAYEDSATLDAVARYRQSVRDTAPWLPRNTEFIRRINGLDSNDAVRDTIFETSYMVLGLGDVYLGAPCAVPVDPRHRLLTSKYNPARTYTAEGTVGIGGVYMCIYGMDSPGGYQLVGRTLPVWNTFLKNAAFIDGKPWLLRFFDQIRFYPVTEAELDVMRDDFREGRQTARIEESVFDLGEYNAFLNRIAPELTTVRARQRTAYEVELAQWQADALQTDEITDTPAGIIDSLNDGTSPAFEGDAISSDIAGNVWKLVVDAGAQVKAGDTLLIVEAMKMEFPIVASRDGVVSAVHCRPGSMIHVGEPLMSLTALA